MNNETINYINDTENYLTNFKLAEWYENQGFTAPGLTFYLRAAERSEDKLFAYNSLLRGFFCYDKQGSRDDSAKILLQNAVSLLPKRPEAYFLLARFFETRKQWQECYIYSSLALECCDFDIDSSDLNVDYPGKYAFIFYKAVSGYWWGKSDESRQLFQELINNYNPEDPYKSAAINNITILGSGPKSSVFKQYKKEFHNQLLIPFSGSEHIEYNYSQTYQDMFVLYMNDGKIGGSYLEIGCGHPTNLNNTFLLEQNFNWSGIGIDINCELVNDYNNFRKNRAICYDATTVDYNELLSKNYSDTIDYLQLDCDPPEITYSVLQKIPFDKYKFKVITYEHDYYVDMTRSYRDKSREYLSNLGYKLVISNISPNSWSSFEDWWVHPDLVPNEKINHIINNNDNIKQIDNYLLNKNNYKTIPINFYHNKSSNPTAIIVDNFYEKPDDVRNFALSEEFSDGGFGMGYIGKRTIKQYLFDGLKERFEDIIGQKIKRWQEHDMNGKFQITYAGQPLVYHCDAQKWAGMIYLTPDAPFECGTTLYAHKKTRARSYYDNGWDYSWKDVHLGDLHLDGTFFEPVDVLGNVYNRLVIFDGSNIHSASKYFGQIDSNARLWHMFFFD